VSGRPGYLSRGVHLGHGPTMEERYGTVERNDWYQGVGRYANYRWRGNPSHHNYDHTLRGLAVYYYFLQKDNPTSSARERVQMDSVRALYTEMMNYAYKSNNGVVLDIDGEPTTNLFREADRPTTFGIMATNSLRFGAWITGDPWYTRKYDELTVKYGYRRPDAAQGLTSDHDDGEHTMGGLWLMCQIEEDPVLRDFYRAAITSLFDSKRRDRWTFFSYMYAGATGDTAGADLPGALETLRIYPTNSISYPFMNSVRTDIEIVTDPTGQLRPKDPLPYVDVPIDGGGWKSNPYQLDRWMARPITAFAVSPEDSMVWLLADAGGVLYQSLDGGAHFTVANFQQGYGKARARVSAIAFGPRSRIILLGTDQGMFRAETGGFNNAWERIPVGTDGNAVRQFIFDPANRNALWAVMDDGIWRSVDLGQEEFGDTWEKLSGAAPAGRNVTYGVVPGPSPMLYAAIRGRVYHRRLGDAGWTVASRDMEGYQLVPEPQQIVGSAATPSTVFLLAGLGASRGNRTVLSLSTDGGMTFTAVGQRRPGPSASATGAGARMERPAQFMSITIDPRDPRIVYGASSKGLSRSTDGGTTWQLSNTGLRIPYVYNVFAPRETPGTIFCSTPAGLHFSRDKGVTWSRPVLVLNVHGVDQWESGGYAYVVAYWPGRYYGYLSDAEVARRPEDWRALGPPGE